MVIVEDTLSPAVLNWAYNSRSTSTVLIDYEAQDSGTGIQALQFWRKETSSSDWILKKTIQGAGVTSLVGLFVYKGLTSGVSYDFKLIARDMVLNETTSATITQATL